jgi:hypothetical protein
MSASPTNSTEYRPKEKKFLTVRQGSLGGLYAYNAFVAKLKWVDSTSTLSLVYSTYLGGNSSDSGATIAVDSSGNAYVAGFASSGDFPTSHPILQTVLEDGASATYDGSSMKGFNNAFVAKLNSTGSALVYSTYLGGSYVDSGNGIAIDSSGNAYVTGETLSSDFPTVYALQALLGGTSTATNAFVAKLNWAASTSTLSLVYSTYLGGSVWDEGYGIAVDSSGNAYVTGVTTSSDFPIAHALQGSLKGPQNAFVAELKWAASTSTLSLGYSTYLGGSVGEWGAGIAVDSSRNAYATGWTRSTDFPTAHPFQASLGGAHAENAFVAKLNSTGSALVYSTYLGGSCSDNGSAIVVDSSGNAHVTGATCSTDFPIANPFQASWAGNFDAFVAKLNWAASSSTLSLGYSTYLGGGDWDEGHGIALDSSGNAYVTGLTYSTNFPTAHPLQAHLGGAYAQNAFVAKISPSSDFRIWACSDSLTVRAGSITICQISLASLDKFAGNVALSYSGLPPHPTCLILPKCFWLKSSGIESSTAFIATGGKTPRGTYKLIFTGTAGSSASGAGLAQNSTSVTLIVK